MKSGFNCVQAHPEDPVPDQPKAVLLQEYETPFVSRMRAVRKHQRVGRVKRVPILARSPISHLRAHTRFNLKQLGRVKSVLFLSVHGDGVMAMRRSEAVAPFGTLGVNIRPAVCQEGAAISLQFETQKVIMGMPAIAAGSFGSADREKMMGVVSHDGKAALAIQPAGAWQYGTRTS